jgi:hypothetical protein
VLGVRSKPQKLGVGCVLFVGMRMRFVKFRKYETGWRIDDEPE